MKYDEILYYSIILISLETVWKHAWNGDERKVIDTLLPGYAVHGSWFRANLPENLLLAGSKTHGFPYRCSFKVWRVKVHGFHGEPPISGMPSGAAIPQGVISPTAKGRHPQPLGLSENVAQPPASHGGWFVSPRQFWGTSESSSFAQASTVPLLVHHGTAKWRIDQNYWAKCMAGWSSSHPALQLRHRWCGLALSMSGLALSGAGAMPVPCQLSSSGILRQEHRCQCWCSFFTWESYLNHLNLPSRESASKHFAWIGLWNLPWWTSLKE